MLQLNLKKQTNKKIVKNIFFFFFCEIFSNANLRKQHNRKQQLKKSFREKNFFKKQNQKVKIFLLQGPNRNFFGKALNARNESTSQHLTCLKNKHKMRFFFFFVVDSTLTNVRATKTVIANQLRGKEEESKEEAARRRECKFSFAIFVCLLKNNEKFNK
jgi:hypothetical protein